MKLIIGLFAFSAIFAIGIGAIATMDIKPEQKTVRKVTELAN